MQVQRVQNNTSFGTKFSQRVTEDLQKTAKNGKINPNIEKNVRTLLADGMDDISIATKIVDNFWSGKNTEVFYVKSDKLDQLIKKAKDDKTLYCDEKYYKAIRYLKETAQIDKINRDNDLCDVKSIKGQNHFLSGSSDKTSSMIYALLRQAGNSVNVKVDGLSTRLADSTYNFWYTFKNPDFSGKFKTIYNEVIKNYELLISRLEYFNK